MRRSIKWQDPTEQRLRWEYKGADRLGLHWPDAHLFGMSDWALLAAPLPVSVKSHGRCRSCASSSDGLRVSLLAKGAGPILEINWSDHHANRATGSESF